MAPTQAIRLDQLWADFVETVGYLGRKAFVDSGANSQELGALIRTMENAHPLREVEDPIIRNLRMRFTKNRTLEEATHAEIKDVYQRMDLAIFATFSYSLTTQAHELQDWCKQALAFHIEGDVLFDFMLSTRFGIVRLSPDAPYREVQKVFDAWVRQAMRTR